jgi:hypothetical protein
MPEFCAKETKKTQMKGTEDITWLRASQDMKSVYIVTVKNLLPKIYEQILFVKCLDLNKHKQTPDRNLKQRDTSEYNLYTDGYTSVS